MNGYLGDFGVGGMVHVPFHTFNAAGASVTLTGLAVTDIEIYKDGGTTQRSSDNGYTLLDTDGIDFDGITGIHGFKVDLSDNSDAGFYAAGHDYFIAVSAVTIDGQTVSFIAATFSIQNRSLHAVLPATIQADGSMPTLPQAVYTILQFLTEKATAGTTVTINNPDGTPLFTLTLNASVNPTSITRAT